MLIGYNQATTLKSSNVETDLKYAEKYDYDCIINKIHLLVILYLNFRMAGYHPLGMVFF